MKKHCISCIFYLFSLSAVFCQVNTNNSDPPPEEGHCEFATNVSCSSAMMLCDDFSGSFLTSSAACGCVFGDSDLWGELTYRPVIQAGSIIPNEFYNAYWGTALYFSFYLEGDENVDMSIEVTGALAFAIEIHGPFSGDTYPCDAVAQGVNIYYGNEAGIYTPNGGQNFVDATLGSGYYFMAVYPRDCNMVDLQIDIDFSAPFSPCISDPPPPCSTCIETFAPQPGNEYLLSGWVKEDVNLTDLLTYANSEIKVSYPSLGSNSVSFEPSGSIIEGWQKIEGVFTVPANATDIKFELICSSGDAVFDDIRVQPFNSSMRTFVFDPITMRMVAEQDDRNYSSFYEYDEEGRLNRVKRETERGIQTIQTIRQNTGIDD